MLENKSASQSPSQFVNQIQLSKTTHLHQTMLQNNAILDLIKDYVQSSVKIRAPLMDSIPSEISSLIANISPFVPTNVKDWHQAFTADLRHNLIQRIIEKIFTFFVLKKKGINNLNDRILMVLIKYALKNEAAACNTANTREEYYQLIAENIYYIQRIIIRFYGGIALEYPPLANPAFGITTEEEVTATFGPFSNVSALEKRRYRYQLLLLVHAYHCQKLDSTNGEVREECYLPMCKGMQHLLGHLMVCQVGDTCAVPNCASSKTILRHLKNCTLQECKLCSSVKKGNALPQQKMSSV